MKYGKTGYARVVKPHAFLALGACLCLLGCAACVSVPGGRVDMLLTNANLIDGAGRRVVDSDTILVIDGKIVSVTKGQPAGLPKGIKRVDCRGGFVTPGFINVHVHDAYDRVQLARWAKAGVTTVRDMGPHEEDYLERYAELSKDVTLSGIVMSSPILRVEGGYGWTEPVADAGDARAYVDALVDLGTQTVKFALEDELPPGRKRTVMPLDVAEAIVSAAHGRGKRATVHVSKDRYAAMAVSAGADEIAHMPVDTLSEETIRAATEAGVMWIPTLELWQGVGWGWMPKQNLRKLREAGARIAFGTDFGGYSIAFDRDFPMREAEAMLECGYSPAEIIASGTGTAAAACGLEGTIGDIAPGCRADLIVCDADPLDGLATLGDPRMVIHNGVILK
jgi:imidazolonepropionase-like amidohydrolase